MADDQFKVGLGQFKVGLGLGKLGVKQIVLHPEERISYLNRIPFRDENFCNPSRCLRGDVDLNRLDRT
jgi:hypothetical protein